MTDEMERVAADVAVRFRLGREQVNAAIELLTQGLSVPFIVRYRKHETKGIKTAPLRQLRRQLDIDANRVAREARKQQHQASKAAPKKPQSPVDLLMSKIKEDAGILMHLRGKLWEEGLLSSVLLSEKKSKKSKKKHTNKPQWADYVYDKTPIQGIPA
ncbi:MAG: Tex-like N-terminal domain-containing protein, partial [Legionella sp.]|nr:Tex-like N-terminal domain-containing protein [Legionella sp.]